VNIPLIILQESQGRNRTRNRAVPKHGILEQLYCKLLLFSKCKNLHLHFLFHAAPFLQRKGSVKARPTAARCGIDAPIAPVKAHKRHQPKHFRRQRRTYLKKVA